MTAAIVAQDDGSVQVKIAGAIDEQADLNGLFKQIAGASSVVFDLAGVERLNSIGVHRWIDSLGPLSAARPTAIEACSYVVALQANCVANLFGKAVVRSTLAPYYCQGCRDTHMVLVAADEMSGGTAPPRRCATCQTVLAFDELDSYFDFLVRDR